MHRRSNFRFLLLPFWLVAILLLALVASPVGAQLRPPPRETAPRVFSIRGTVRADADSRTLEMVRVDLKRSTGEVVSTTFTRSNGEFEFGGLSNGVYYVALDERGYEQVNERVEIMNSSRPGVFIFLRKPLRPEGEKPGPTTSVREMSLPGKARDAMQRGMDRLAKRDYPGSLVQFQKVVAVSPTYYEAYYQMGLAQLKMGQTADAEKSLRKAIELSGKHFADSYFLLASILSNQKNFQEAEGLAREGLAIDANLWSGHYELARALAGLNRDELAAKSAEEARKRRPDFPELYLLLANLHIRQRDYRALLNDLDTYLNLAPNGEMSEQVRQTRDKVKQELAKSQGVASPPEPKP